MEVTQSMDDNDVVVDNHIEHFEEVTTQFGQDYTEDLNYLLNSIQKNKLKLDIVLITEAFDLCYNSHIGIKRVSGVAYYTHPLAVALIMIEELKLNETSLIIAALLHSVLRDNTQLNIVQIRSEFGDKVANLLINIDKVQKQSRNDSSIKTDNPKAFHKLFLMIIRDVRIFVLQLCNRLHDIRTLQYLPKHNQVEIAQETLNFYVPFAFKLGFTKIQAELEAKAFYYYNPNQYQRIQEFLLFKRKVFTEFMYMLDDYIKQCLDKNRIGYSISIKHKQEYEIFLLMQDGKKIEEIDSIFSLNVYIKTTETLDCLNVGQILCEHLNKINYIDVTLQPHIEINDDIIADLYGPFGKTQLIICSNEKAKEQSKAIFKKIEGDNKTIDNNEFSDEDIELWGNWMQYIIENNEPQEAEHILWTSIKANLYRDTIKVFSKSGASVILPRGASVIDFAFAISKKLGLSAITCKIGGVIKDIFSEVKNGDIIELITSNKSHPDSNWLNNVITYKANAHLTNYFKAKFNLLPTPKNNKKQCYQLMKFGCLTDNGILKRITSTIGAANIVRIKFASPVNFFVFSIYTTFLENEIDNKLFYDLISIKGVKQLEILYKEY